MLTPLRTVGVMGDFRTYGNMVALRIVTSDDGMTADWARVPYDVLARISNRIVNEVPGVNRVTSTSRRSRRARSSGSRQQRSLRLRVCHVERSETSPSLRIVREILRYAQDDKAGPGADASVIPRYSHPDMARIWADEQKYEYWRRVEVAVCEAWSELGVVPEGRAPGDPRRHASI